MCESINGTIIETLIRSAVTWSSRPPISCNGFGGDDLPPGVDPIIAGLIARLPESGSEWSIQKRELWLAILKSTFDLVYKDNTKPERQHGDTV